MPFRRSTTFFVLPDSGTPSRCDSVMILLTRNSIASRLVANVCTAIIVPPCLSHLAEDPTSELVALPAKRPSTGHEPSCASIQERLPDAIRRKILLLPVSLPRHLHTRAKQAISAHRHSTSALCPISSQAGTRQTATQPTHLTQRRTPPTRQRSSPPLTSSIHPLSKQGHSAPAPFELATQRAESAMKPRCLARTATAEPSWPTK